MADKFMIDGEPVQIVQLENQKWEAQVGASPPTVATFNSKPDTDQIKKLVDLHKVTRAVFTPGK